MSAPMSLPFSPDSEKAFLCSLIKRPDLIEQCETLNFGIFFEPAHQGIFQMLIDLRTSNQPIDFITCKSWLRNNNEIEKIGGLEYLNSIWSFLDTAAAWEHYLEILKEQFIRRNTIISCNRLVQKMYDQGEGCCDSIKELVETTLSRIVTDVRPEPKKWGDIVDDAVSYVESNVTGVWGIQFGIPGLDQAIGGIRPGEDAIICARSSDGKTALATQAVLHTALSGKNVALFSFEMTAMRMALRMISKMGEISMRSIRSKLFSPSELTRWKSTPADLKSLPINVEDAFSQDINGVVNRCRQLHAKYRATNPLSLVVVDYLQLVTPVTKKSDTREREVADISRRLKNLCGELGISVIKLSQLTDEGKLRESRAPGHDADTVIRIKTPDLEERSKKEIILEKQRDGEAGIVVPVEFQGEYMAFSDRQDED